MSMYCPNCGQPTTDEVTFCGNCGQPLKARTQPESPPARRRGLWVGAIIFLLVILAAAAIVLYSARAPFGVPFMAATSITQVLPERQLATAVPDTPVQNVAVTSQTPVPATAAALPTKTPAPTKTSLPEATTTPTPQIIQAVAIDDDKVYLGDTVILDTAVEELGCFGIGEISYSPTGEYFVVVLSCFEGDNEAFAFRADGSDKRRITDQWDYINYNQYEWSAAGQYFVYQRINSCCADPPPDAPPPGTVWYDVVTGEKLEPEAESEPPTPQPDEADLLPLTGNGVVRLTFDSASHYTPAFSPDQQQLILSAKIGNRWQVVEADANGGGMGRQITRAAANFYQPQYAADAQTFLAASDMDGDLDIYLLNTATGEVVQQLTNNPGDDYHPRWLPDESGFVFSSGQDGNDEIYLGRLDGTQTRLTNNTAYDGFATVSPDGQQVTFYSSRDGDYEIYVLDIDSSNPTRLTFSPGRDADPVFSPDGEWIAFESERNGNYDIFAMRQDGTDLRQLTSNSNGDWFPVFSPDGLWLLFQSNRTGNMDIFRLPFLAP